MSGIRSGYGRLSPLAGALLLFAGQALAQSPAPLPNPASPPPPQADAEIAPHAGADPSPTEEPAAGDAATPGGAEPAASAGSASTPATLRPTDETPRGPAFATAPSAAASLEEPRADRRYVPLRERMERPHGMIEAGLGWLTLPNKEVCSVRTGAVRCARGDASPTLEAWQIFRLARPYALGAGVMLGLIPTTDTPALQLEGIEREHSRGYLTIEGTGRYYAHVGETLEAWVGVTAGLVVVSDGYEAERDTALDKPLVGTGGVVIRSEGLSSSLAGGFAYEFARAWSVGATLRIGAWSLPSEPKLSPLGDEASLTGQAWFFVLGAVLAYRVPL